MTRATSLLVSAVLIGCVPSAVSVPAERPWSGGPAGEAAAAAVTEAAAAAVALRRAVSPHTAAEGGARAAPFSSSDATALEAAVLEAVNAARVAAGSRPLMPLPAMQRAARRYSRELAARRVIDHLSSSPGGRTFRERIESEGVRARIAGENLARLTAVSRDLGERVVAAWSRSPDHRKNMLDPIFARSGIGVWLGDDGVWYVVHVLATGD